MDNAPHVPFAALERAGHTLQIEEPELFKTLPGEWLGCVQASLKQRDLAEVFLQIQRERLNLAYQFADSGGNQMFRITHAAPDFVVELGACWLKQESRNIFFTQLEEWLREEIPCPLFGYRTNYRWCIEWQARLFANAIAGEIDEYPPVQAREASHEQEKHHEQPDHL